MNSRANTFFVEIIFVILFFSVSLAITLGLFSGAEKASILSKEKTEASMEAQTAAEEWKSSDTRAEFLKLVDASEKSENEYQIAYDSEWKPTRKAPVYVMTLKLARKASGAGEVMYLSAVVTKAKGDNKLFTLETARYFADKGADAYETAQ